MTEPAYKRPPPKFLRSAQVADILSVSPKTVQRYAREGKLPFQLTLGGHRRYEERAIRALVAELTDQATDGPLAGGASP